MFDFLSHDFTLEACQNFFESCLSILGISLTSNFVSAANYTDIKDNVVLKVQTQNIEPSSAQFGISLAHGPILLSDVSQLYFC